MEEQLNMMRRGRQFKQLMNKKMDGIIREYDEAGGNRDSAFSGYVR